MNQRTVILKAIDLVVFKFQDTRAQWQIVFYIAAGVYITGAFIYVLFARGDEQPWNNCVKGVSFKHREEVEVVYPQQVQSTRFPLPVDHDT